MTISPALYTSNSDEYETPPELFERLNKRFAFTLDPCATPATAKCPKFYTKEDDGLSKDWSGERVFCNPPYSEVGKWVEKARNSHDGHTWIVLLIPARTDTRWFHDHLYEMDTARHRVYIEFLRGRLKFHVNGAPTKNSAPFPSMVVVMI
jgi:phage N-6-adenine-methyltransferase